MVCCTAVAISCLLNRDSLWNGDRQRHHRHHFSALLSGIAHHHRKVLAEGDKKGIRGSFEHTKGLDVAGIGNAKSERWRGLVSGIENDLNSICTGDLFQNHLRLAPKVEAVLARRT